LKILFFTHTFPYPLAEGIKLMAFNLIKELSARHEIHLFSLLEKDTDTIYIPELLKYCKTVQTSYKKLPKSAFLRLWNMYFQNIPYNINQFYAQEAFDKLHDIIKKERFDLVHFNFFTTSGYRKAVPEGIPAVLCNYDAMSLHFLRNKKRERNLFKKIYLSKQWKKIAKYEKQIISRFDKTVVVSSVDKDWLCALFAGSGQQADITVIPIGVDTGYFTPQEAPKDNPSLIFRGIMDFKPNTDAIIHFYKNIFPLIKKKLPDIRLYIVGKNPINKIKSFATDKSVTVTGYVEDIRPYIAKATVNICPMRIGTGMKFKIIESMAMGIPTVATNFACAGIEEIKNGENILVADSPADFSKTVVNLIQDKPLIEKISRNGLEIIRKNYSWPIIASKFETLYKETLRA